MKHNIVIKLLFALALILELNGCGDSNIKLTNDLFLTNPVAEDGADPWIIKYDGAYYYCYSEDTMIAVSKSDKIEGALVDPGQIVFNPPRGTEYSEEIWAPELHYISGKWYIYFAADDGDNYNHRMYVLESDSTDAFGPYTFKGKISSPSDKWAIDGTVLEYNQKLYFIWSGWEGYENVSQNLYIAEMENPYTIKGERIMISRPEYDWERIGNPLINEGPQILKNQGKVFIIYSASGSWTDNYCLGQLELISNYPLDSESWVKKSQPVFSGTEKVISPGHASFTKSPDGSEDWIVYHAAKHKGAGWNRNIRMQKFEWDDEGNPIFGFPISEGVKMPAPSNY